MHCTSASCRHGSRSAKKRSRRCRQREPRPRRERLSRGNKNELPTPWVARMRRTLLTSLQRLRRCPGAQGAPWRMVKMRYACDTQARRHNQQTAVARAGALVRRAVRLLMRSAYRVTSPGLREIYHPQSRLGRLRNHGASGNSSPMNLHRFELIQAFSEEREKPTSPRKPKG